MIGVAAVSVPIHGMTDESARNATYDGSGGATDHGSRLQLLRQHR
jgi:hypothetical protein